MNLAGACFCLLSGCGPAGQEKTAVKTTSYEQLEQAAWLLGTWQNRSEQAVATETWKKVNDSTYAGKSYVLAGKDTVSSEAISLLQSGRDLLYIPVVKGQNAGLPVAFTMTRASDKLLVFENPAHDFPQKITYTRISKDSLLAEISGTINGEEESQQFPMTRMQ